MVSTLEAIEDRVIVVPDSTEDKTPGGILLPESAQKKPSAGRVSSVGPGTPDVSMTVKVGDRVFYGKWNGTEIEFGGETVVVIRQGDILAVAR